MEALFGHPILQSLLAGILSWISVSLGASAIFLRREFSRLAMDCMLGAAGGMMLGAAFLALKNHLIKLLFYIILPSTICMISSAF